MNIFLQYRKYDGDRLGRICCAKTSMDDFKGIKDNTPPHFIEQVAIEILTSVEIDGVLTSNKTVLLEDLHSQRYFWDFAAQVFVANAQPQHGDFSLDSDGNEQATTLWLPS